MDLFICARACLFSLIPLSTRLSVHVLSALFKSFASSSLLLYRLRLACLLNTCLFLAELTAAGGRSMEERVKGGGEPLEVEQQERAARLAKRRFGAVGPPPSS